MSNIKESWDADPDMGNRDPNSLNEHLKVSFEEVLGEPDHTQSIDCVWKFSYKCFNLWKTLCYIICTTLCGICIASCWGCEFACIAFCHIWFMTPCIRCFEINVAMGKKISAILFDCCVGTYCEAVSRLFTPFAKS